MKNKFICLLLSLCMAASLSIHAMADTPSASVTLTGKTIKINGYDSPAYSVNTNTEAKDTAGNMFTAGIQTEGSASNWNAKLIWHSGDTIPTLYLNNFVVDEYNEKTSKWTDSASTAIAIPSGQPIKIILTGKSSQIKSHFGIVYKSSLNITSQESTKLSIWNRSSAITSGNATGCNLVLDADLDLFVASYYDTNSHILQTNSANLTINSGNIKITSGDETSLVGILTRNSGNIIINGGNLDVTSSIGAAPTNGSVQSAGKILIAGGTVKATAKATTALYAKNGIEINDGLVDILSPYYGINAGTPDEPADIAIHGGTVKIDAKYAFFTYPSLGEDVFAYAGADEASAKDYDGTYTPMAKEPWMLISNDPAQIRTDPSAPTTAPTTSAAPSQPRDQDRIPYLNPSLVYWFAATGTIGLIGLIVTLIVYKRKKP